MKVNTLQYIITRLSNFNQQLIFLIISAIPYFNNINHGKNSITILRLNINCTMPKLNVTDF